MTHEVNMAVAFPVDDVSADVVVVGGGVAGLCAAVAAGRSGAATVLVTDRPVLGGNCSSEIRVGMNGAAYSPFNLWSRETGVVEEIRNRHADLWSGSPDSYWAVLDRVYFDLATEERTLRLFLNTTIVGAARGDDGTVTGVEGIQLRAERRYRFSARWFIDCSGDGVLAPLTGADFRQGREAQSEFDEPLAPKAPDNKTMGATLLWTTRDAGRPVPFKAPDWAIDVSRLKCFDEHGSDPTRTVHVPSDGRYYGLWWAEYGGEMDAIRDDQEIAWHTRRLVYGIWNWIKNSGRIQGVENLELDWVASLPGKRESRRLLGPEIITEHDWRNQTQFADAVAHTGWPIDVHPPGGYLDKEPGCTHVWLPGPSDIPLQALYSRNVPNLFFAGRNLSATHAALGSPRVIATTGAMGQAVGVAAAFCAQRQRTPKALTEADVAEIQQRLLRLDQGIIGRRLAEADDLAQSATIRASSVRRFELLEGSRLLALDPQGVAGCVLEPVDETVPTWFTGSAGAFAAIPAAQAAESLSFRFRGKAGQTVACRVYLTDRPENYRFDHLLKETSAALDDEGWARFPIGAEPGAGLKFLFHFPPQEGVGLVVSPILIPGVGVARLWNRPETDLRDLEPSRRMLTPCFRLDPYQDLLAAENVADGHIRPYGLPHLWSSAGMSSDQPEWLELAWREPVTLGRIELVFDSQLNGENVGRAGCLIRDYDLAIITPDRQEIPVVSQKDNSRRFRAHTFESRSVIAARLAVHATWGAAFASVYAARAYAG